MVSTRADRNMVDSVSKALDDLSKIKPECRENEFR